MQQLPKGLLGAISGFKRDTLKETETVVRSLPVLDYVAVDAAGAVLHMQQKHDYVDIMEGGEPGQHLEVGPNACHGRCYGFESERQSWENPRLAVKCNAEARPGYSSLDASEYLDTRETLAIKVRKLAHLIRQSECCVVYSGAGLSTGAGIGDYASQAPCSLTNVVPARSALLSEIAQRSGSTKTVVPARESPPTAFQSPLCAQPTHAHRVLVAMHSAGLLHRWINQNHDGLPQKAGLPQEAINELHGAWHAPNNPVVQMSGSLRSDLFQDLLYYEKNCDLAIAVGTSLCGMNADRVVTSVAGRTRKGNTGQLGSVIIGLQRTVHDEDATLRIFGRCDDVFAALAEELALQVTPPQEKGTFWVPPVLMGREQDQYVFEQIPYDACGEKSASSRSTLDLRDEVELVIPDGMHAGAVGEIDGCDREGNIRCRFKLKPKVGKLRAPVMLLIGRWWIQAAVDGTVPSLPVVNKPAETDTGDAAETLRGLMQKYATLV